MAGILAWKVGPGEFVEEGQLLGEVVNMEDPFAARTPIVSRTAGKRILLNRLLCVVFAIYFEIYCRE